MGRSLVAVAGASPASADAELDTETDAETGGDSSTAAVEQPAKTVATNMRRAASKPVPRAVERLIDQIVAQRFWPWTGVSWPRCHDGGVDAQDVVRNANQLTVLTGAGVSTASGIPDFRGPQGMWTNDPSAARMFDINVYRRDPEVRVEAWRNRGEHPAWTAVPNAAHFALAELERQGRMRALVTQNIDELHQQAGSGVSAPLLEVHGSIKRYVCLTCGERGPMSEALDRVAAGEPDPDCRLCGGILKSDTISFGQALDPAVLNHAVTAAADCDVFLAVGTSLQVHPVAGLVDVAHRAGAAIVIVNGEPTPYDSMATAVVREPIEIALPRMVSPAN